jgi:hypothetical protein
MLKNQPAAGFQQVTVNYGNRDFLYALQLVRRITENDIIAGIAVAQKPEGIGPERQHRFEAKIRYCFSDEVHTPQFQINACHAPGSPAGKFIGDIPCTRKKIKHCYILKVKVIHENIKQRLFGKVSGRPYRQVTGGMDLPAFMGTAYDSHNEGFKRV